MANLEQPGEAASGPWQKIPLYSKLDDTSLALAKLYQESPIQTSDNTSKSSVYKHNTGVVEKSGAKLYKGDVRDGSIPAGISRKPSTATKVSYSFDYVDICAGISTDRVLIYIILRIIYPLV